MFPLLCWWTGIFMLRGSPSNSPRLPRESPLGHRARQVFTLSSVPLASRWPSILENIKLLCGSEAIDKCIALGDEEFVFLWIGRGKVRMGGGATLYILFQQLQVFLKIGLWCRFFFFLITQFWNSAAFLPFKGIFAVASHLEYTAFQTKEVYFVIKLILPLSGNKEEMRLWTRLWGIFLSQTKLLFSWGFYFKPRVQ